VRGWTAESVPTLSRGAKPQDSEQEATIAEFRKEMETRLREQDSKIQKVSDQMELGNALQRIVRAEK